MRRYEKVWEGMRGIWEAYENVMGSYYIAMRRVCRHPTGVHFEKVWESYEKVLRREKVWEGNGKVSRRYEKVGEGMRRYGRYERYGKSMGRYGNPWGGMRRYWEGMGSMRLFEKLWEEYFVSMGKSLEKVSGGMRILYEKGWGGMGLYGKVWEDLRRYENELSRR